MRFAGTLVLAFLSSFLTFPLSALPRARRGPQTSTASQLPPQRDPQAVAIVRQSVTAMASTAPTDSSATGTVTVVEGSTTQSGSIQIFTLGTDQTSETLILPTGQRATIYSNGDAKETDAMHSINPPLELIVTDQCPDFPLPLLLAALNNGDAAFRYVGAESLNGSAVQHIQFWNSFTSKPRLQKLAPFSIKDVWFDSTSSLPIKISYARRGGGGAAPAFPVDVSFANYTNVGGVLYPFQIKKSFNGTPWQTITVQSVSFNSGLTASQFQVE